MIKNPDQPIILVTGSNKRTGKEIAINLASDAGTVIVCSRSGEGAEDVVKAIEEKGAQSYALTVDVSQPQSVANCIDSIIKRSGRLDILINNVGDLLEKPILETNLEEWNYMMNSNLTSAFLMCKEAIPHMIQHNFGRIINITDATAHDLKSAPNSTAYKIAKTGLIILSKSLAKACASYDITVNTIAPGVLENSIIKPNLSKIPKNRYGQPQELASAIRYLISPQASYVTGSNIDVTGGYNI